MNDMLPLIEPLIPALRRYARALMKDRAAADDLVQDCLERAITNWGRRRADGNPRAWVFTILHNLAMTRLKQGSRRARDVTLDDAQEDVFAVAPAQDNGLRYRDLLAALARIPEDQRSVLLLTTVEDLTYAEAAKVLDVPIGTVMSRLSRARERLLKEMDGSSIQDAHPHLRRVK